MALKILWYNNYPFDKQLKRYSETLRVKTMTTRGKEEGSESRSCCLLWEPYESCCSCSLARNCTLLLGSKASVTSWVWLCHSLQRKKDQSSLRFNIFCNLTHDQFLDLSKEHFNTQLNIWFYFVSLILLNFQYLFLVICIILCELLQKKTRIKLLNTFPHIIVQNSFCIIWLYWPFKNEIQWKLYYLCCEKSSFLR